MKIPKFKSCEHGCPIDGEDRCWFPNLIELREETEILRTRYADRRVQKYAQEVWKLLDHIEETEDCLPPPSEEVEEIL